MFEKPALRNDMMTDVLVVGAGPTGLVLALFLKKMGVNVRIIDKAAQTGTTSRAVVVHARTLEFYRQLGIADAIIEQGQKMQAVNLWVSGEKIVKVPLNEIGKGLSPFPFMLMYPQDEHESFLTELLTKAGVTVERPIELLGFTEGKSHIEARLKMADGREEICDARFIAGCDGAHSQVRKDIGTGFPGSTYNQLFYVADIQAQGQAVNHELHVALDEADFLAVFGMKGEGKVRLIGVISPEAEKRGHDIGWEDVRQIAMDRMKLKIEKVNWFSTYHVHHRVSEHFRRGRAFLLGDAAHIHSPVGGQGMNTGIGDAVNLAWKLAQVLKGKGPVSWLDSYEVERIAFARKLVHTTDLAFSFIINSGAIARWVRTQLLPFLLPKFFLLEKTKRFLFLTASQIAIQYRQSILSEGQAGMQGGDRLPWVRLTSGSDNFESLASLNWQVHIYGDLSPVIETEFKKILNDFKMELCIFPWEESMTAAGLRQNAGYLVRPDGYIALADGKPTAERFKKYFTLHGFMSSDRRQDGLI